MGDSFPGGRESLESLVGLVLGLALGGGADTAEKPRTVTETRTEYVTVIEEATSEEATSTSASQSAGGDIVPDKDCSIGQECDLGQSSVTVTNVERTQQINTDFSSSAYAGEYVVVGYDYTYGGTSPATVDEPVGHYRMPRPRNTALISISR